MGILNGTKGLVFGVANDRSLAWMAASNLMSEGATCAFAYLPGEKMERRVRRTLESAGVADPVLVPCDASKDADLDAAFDAVAARFDTIDFVIHSIAYADREYLQPDRFADTPRDVFAQAMDISAYTLLAMGRRARRLMPNGGAIIGMTYYGSEKVIPGYNVMGVAKAALECTARYLAAELGPKNIRVNLISAGPCRTLSAMAVGGIDEMFEWTQRKAPLRRNIDPEEVGRTAVFLASRLSSGITGETLFVDAGYNIMGL
jgi:enoyl-[acyl-carrier protein] reductase I